MNGPTKCEQPSADETILTSIGAEFRSISSFLSKINIYFMTLSMNFQYQNLKLCHSRASTPLLLLVVYLLLGRIPEVQLRYGQRFLSDISQTIDDEQSQDYPRLQ